VVLLWHLAWASQTLRTSGWWFPSDAEGAVRYLRRFAITPLNAEFFGRMPVIVIGVFLLSLARAELPKRQWRLALCCVTWIVAWWVVTPIANLKGSRYYPIVAPMILLGTIGWHSIASAAQGEAAGRRVFSLGSVVASVWLAALMAIWVSPRSGIRAAVWLTAAIPVCFILAWRAVLWVSSSGTRLAEQMRGPVILAFLTVLTQLGPYLDWMLHRSYLVSTALSEFAAMALPPGDICGGEAPTLMLARPGEGEALYQVDYPDCRRNGRKATYVIFAERADCSPFESDWIASQRVRLPPLSGVGVLFLPSEPVSGRKDRCAYHIAALPPE